MPYLSRLCILWLIVIAVRGAVPAFGETRAKPDALHKFIQANCCECHDSETSEGGLDLSPLGFDLGDRNVFQRWVLIHDRIRDGEMPPPDTGHPIRVVPIGWSSQPIDGEVGAPLSDVKRFLRELAASLNKSDRERIDSAGRAKVRRLNRLEYENTLQQVLDAPWLQVATLLPEDGIDHLFNKVGDRLDVSHVQMSRYLDVASDAIYLAIDAAAHPSQKRKFYAREERSMQGYLHYRFGQTAATRSIVPLLGTTPEPEIIRKNQPVTVGDADPEKRELESMGVFSGTYNATTKYDFTRIDAPTDGHYTIRFKTYTFMAGPNGASGGTDHGLTGGKRNWWRPDRNVAFPGTRSEPITLYALTKSGDSRWLTTFDSFPEATVFECVVGLRRGEGIRPDAARLVRTRPGWSGNPGATKEGVPGFAMNWLEVEGPLQEKWPPASYWAIFGDLPFEVVEGKVKAVSEDPTRDARQLLTAFYKRAMAEKATKIESAEPFIELFEQATALEQDFTDAIVSAISAILCSPDFLYLHAAPGPLATHALNQRLAYFLWNGPPNVDVRGVRIGQSTMVADRSAIRTVIAADRGAISDNTSDETQRQTGHEVVVSQSEMRQRIDQMLDDARSNRFINAFLDYWLDLRDINANAPDAELYPDYYLDELLTESSVRETRMFFRELIDKDLPVRNLVQSDFAFVNERLAKHYGLPAFEGIEPRRVAIPGDSPRGGLLTQSSVLRVTANGTTTSPVTRGAWIVERIMGVDIPEPPSGVAAVEPDIRGAKTIREQLEKHRSIESCNACHARFDPIGFALESFDVTGGWRDRYRAVGEKGEAVEGLGKNGHAFKFKLAQSVDCSGTLRSGDSFDGIRELKTMLVSDERQLARNLLHQLIVYSTGAPVTFGDRAEIEEMLERAKQNDYGVRTLIHELVQSKIFGWK